MKSMKRICEYSMTSINLTRRQTEAAPCLNCPVIAQMCYKGKEIRLWAPATKVRQNLSIVAKNENSTEHFVLCELNQANFFKYVDLSNIT